MVEEQKEEPKVEPIKVEMPFPIKVGQDKWPLLDDWGKAIALDRTDKDTLSIGFMGFNDNKKIVLSSSIDKWEAVAQDILAIVRNLRKTGKTSKI